MTTNPYNPYVWQHDWTAHENYNQHVSVYLRPGVHERTGKYASRTWEQTSLGHDGIEKTTAFMVAEGVKLIAECEDNNEETKKLAQKILDKFWFDPITDLEERLDSHVRSLLISGVLCLPVFTNEFTGHIRLGYLNPNNIEAIIHDPDNPSVIICVVEKTNIEGKQRSYKTVFNQPDAELFGERAQKIRLRCSHECFYLRIANLPDDPRGRSFYLPVIDLIDAFDKAMFDALEREISLRSVYWDVEVPGATPETIANLQKTIKQPMHNSIHVHNGEIWKAMTPDTKPQNIVDILNFTKANIISCLGLPKHWFNDGGDVNRATAGEMGDPTYKILTAHQRKIKGFIEKIANHQLHSVWTTCNYEGEPPYAIAQFPDLKTSDLTKNSAAFAQIVNAALVATKNQLLTLDTGMLMLSTVAGQLGVEFDPVIETKKLKGMIEEKHIHDSTDVSTDDVV